MKLLDLTQSISAEMPVYPGTKPPSFYIANTVEQHGFAELEMNMVTHTGTHIDCSAHVYNDGISLDKLPIEHFTGTGIVVDCSYLNKGDIISSSLISNIEEKLSEVDFVLFYTGWGMKWGKEEYFYDFPTISHELALKLSNFKLKGIGIDTISIEPITSVGLEIHKIILGNKMIIIENLTNLKELVDKSFELYCYPLKIRNADGSPIRAVAKIL